MYHIGGIPGRRKHFFEKSLTPKVSQVAFLNIFSKFQKDVLEGIRRHLTYYWGVENFDPFYFSRTEISKHAGAEVGIHLERMFKKNIL